MSCLVRVGSVMQCFFLDPGELDLLFHAMVGTGTVKVCADDLVRDHVNVVPSGRTLARNPHEDLWGRKLFAPHCLPQSFQEQLAFIWIRVWEYPPLFDADCGVVPCVVQYFLLRDKG